MLGFRLNISALLLLALLRVPALGQTPNSTDNYTSFEAFPGKQIQLGYYASAKKDCMPAPLPVVRIIEPPKRGMFTVRHGVLNTSQIAGCENLKIPADVVFYVARAGATGTDHLIYQVVSANGDVGKFDVSIEIKELPTQPGKPASAPKMDQRI